MKFTATITALVAGAISLVGAQQDAGVYFTNPTLGAVWNAGAPQSITWTVTNSNVTEIDALELRHGAASNLALVQTIFNTPIRLSLGKYDWAVPSNLTTDTSYVLLAKNVAGSSYSAYFTIIGQAPGTNSTTSNSTTSAVSVATAVSTAVAGNSSSSVLSASSASASHSI